MADGSPSFIDTSSDLLRPTVKDPGTGGSLEASADDAKQLLPVARRLHNTLSEYVIDDELPSSIAHLRSPSSLKEENFNPHLAHRESVSKWFWLVATVGEVLAIILLLICLVLALQ